MTDRKLMLLAIDASSAERMEGWVADGSLPNLARLYERGAWGRIESTGDFMAGTPWPSFFTGSLPPEHGWMFYLAWRPDLMRFVRTSPDWQPIEPFYRNFPLNGPRVVAIDVPIACAPRPFGGVELTGWGTHDKVGNPAAYPAALAARVRREIGPQPILNEQAGPQSARELLALRDEMIAATDWQRRAGELLLRENAWELFMLCFGSVHRIGHKIWNSDSAVGKVSDTERAALGDALHRVTVATDRAIGQLIDAAGPGTDVIVFSLHGMIENYSLFPLYDRMLDRILAGEHRDDPETPIPSPGARLREAIPLRLRSRVKEVLPFAVQDAMTLFWRRRRQDWSRTRAFVMAGDPECFIRINLRGRERDGIVAPGIEQEALLEEIAAGFETFRDMDTDDPLVLDIHRGEAVWPEAIQRRSMPDLVIRNRRRPSRMIRGMVSERFGTVRNYEVGLYIDGRSGHHVGEGWFAAVGPGIVGRGEQPKLHEFDLLASAHALLGQPMEPGMHGRPAPFLSSTAGGRST